MSSLLSLSLSHKDVRRHVITILSGATLRDETYLRMLFEVSWFNLDVPLTSFSTFEEPLIETLSFHFEPNFSRDVCYLFFMPRGAPIFPMLREVDLYLLCLVGKSRISYFVWGRFIRYRLECSYALEALFLFDPGHPSPPPSPPPNLTDPFASVTFSLASLVGSRSHSGCLVMVNLTPLTLWIHCVSWHFLYLHCAP